jgi:hypothetical protein
MFGNRNSLYMILVWSLRDELLDYFLLAFCALFDAFNLLQDVRLLNYCSLTQIKQLKLGSRFLFQSLSELLVCTVKGLDVSDQPLAFVVNLR